MILRITDIFVLTDGRTVFAVDGDDTGALPKGRYDVAVNGEVLTSIEIIGEEHFDPTPSNGMRALSTFDAVSLDRSLVQNGAYTLIYRP
jgi:hypothetical protein